MLDIIGMLTSSGSSILVGIGAVLTLIVAAFFKGKSSERTRQKAKEADSYEKHLKDVADAHNARNSVDPHRLPVDDPYRRD